MQKGLITFKDMLIGDRIFQVPIYQRNYSWEEKQWDDLWDDLFYLKSGKRHYFGTLLLRTTEECRKSGVKSFEVHEIIDGQQRTATVLVLLKEIIRQLQTIDDEDIKGQIGRLTEDYLIYRDVYKLELLGDDKEFFRKCIIEDIDYPDEILTPSQRRLRKAKLFFRNKIEHQKTAAPADAFKDFLLGLKQKVDNMDIITYEVENSADAVLIFETVNDRGKILTNLEKTKSFLMHAIYLSAPEELSDYLRQVDNRFANIFRWFEVIKNTERGENLREDDIQRYHFIVYETEASSRREESYQYMRFLRQKVRQLYRKDTIKCLEFALDYTKDLEIAFFTLKEISTLNDKSEIEDILKRIFALERVANFFPLMIAAWIEFRKDKEKLQTILRLIETLAFRAYAIGRRRADAGEGWLYDLAYSVHRNSLDYDGILNELEEIINYYANNRAFERDLKHDEFYTRVANRDVKYVLYEYEKFLREASGEPLDVKLEDILSPKFQIEHIWPQDTSKLGLSEESKRIHENYMHKLGNLTIASKYWNSRWGNEPFNTKKDEYRKSLLRVQKDLSEMKKWGEYEIEERQNKLVRFALERWRI